MGRSNTRRTSAKGEYAKRQRAGQIGCWLRGRSVTRTLTGGGRRMIRLTIASIARLLLPFRRCGSVSSTHLLLPTPVRVRVRHRGRRESARRRGLLSAWRPPHPVQICICGKIPQTKGREGERGITLHVHDAALDCLPFSWFAGGVSYPSSAH